MSKHVRDWNTIVDTKPSPKTVKGYAAGGTTASKTPAKSTTSLVSDLYKNISTTAAKATTPTKTASTTTPTKTTSTATPTKTASTTTPTKTASTSTPTKTTSTATPTKTASTTASKTPAKSTTSLVSDLYKNISTTASKTPTKTTTTATPNKTTSTATPPVNDRSIGSTTSKGLTANADAKSTNRTNVNTGITAGSQTTSPPVVNKAIADAVANKPVDLGLTTVVDTKPPTTGLGVGPLVPDALAEAQKAADAKAAADKAAADKAAADKAAADKAAADKAAADKAAADKAAADAVVADLRKQMDDMKAAYETQRTQYQSASDASLADLKKQIADMLTAQQAEKDRIASEKATADKAAADKAEADRQAAEAAKSKPFDIDQFKNLILALGVGPQVAQAQPVQQQPKTQVTQFDPFYSGFNASRPPVQQPLMSMDQQGQFMFGTGTQTPFSGFGFQNAYIPKETQNTGNP